MIYVVGDQKHGHDRDLLHLEPNSYLVQLDLLPHGRALLHWRICPVVLVVDFWKTLEFLPVGIVGLPHVKSRKLLVGRGGRRGVRILKAGLAGSAFAAWRV